MKSYIVMEKIRLSGLLRIIRKPSAIHIFHTKERPSSFTMILSL